MSTEAKLTRQVAQKQAARLQANLLIVPQSEEGRREVVDLLLRHCQSAEHAERTMTRFLETAIECRNLTAELVAMANQTAAAEQAPAGCPECYLGTDLDTGEVRYAAHVSRTVGGYDFAMRCSCRRGQWLAAKDGERRQAAPPRESARETQRARDAALLDGVSGDYGQRAANDGPEAA